MKKLLVFAVLASGCVKSMPPYTIVQKSAVNPLAPAKKISLRPPMFSAGLKVNNDLESAFIAGLDAKEKTDWEALKASLDPHMKEGVGDVRGDSGGTPPLVVTADAASGDDRVLEAELQSVDFNYCKWTVSVKDAAGTTLEVFKMQTATKKSMGDLTVWQALPVCSWSVGALIARYVGARGEQG